MELKIIETKSYLVLFFVLAFAPFITGTALFYKFKTVNNIVFWGILAFVIFVFIIIVFFMLQRKIEIADRKLIIKSTFYSKTVDLSEVTAIEKIICKSKADQIGLRTNGIGLPGFRSGWFIMKGHGRIFVDLVGGDYLLIFVNKNPQLALEFVDNTTAHQILNSFINKGEK